MTENENGNQSAFSRTDAVLQQKIGRGISYDDYLWRTSGLTKREYFAAMAMQGILANRNFIDIDMRTDEYCKCAVFYAESLLNQLNKK